MQTHENQAAPFRGDPDSPVVLARRRLLATGHAHGWLNSAGRRARADYLADAIEAMECSEAAGLRAEADLCLYLEGTADLVRMLEDCAAHGWLNSDGRRVLASRPPAPVGGRLVTPL